jgi:hypothetical protein
MAEKSPKAKDEKTTVSVPANNPKEKERFVGTQKGRYLIKTQTNVKVPQDVREALELAEMQRNARLRRVEKMRLKDPDELK